MLSLTRGHLAKTPSGPHKAYYRKLAWASASFSFMADVALGSYGGSLKLREKITGRYADILSWMYLATATMHRFEAEGQRKEHLPFMHWSLQYSFARIQEAFDGIYENFDAPILKWIFRGPVAFWSRFNRMEKEPNDELGVQMVKAMMKPGEVRDSITPGLYIPDDVNEAIGRYEHAFKLVTETADIGRRIQVAMRKKKIPKGPVESSIDAALAGYYQQRRSR